MSEEQERLNEDEGLKSFEDEITTNWEETTETFDELDLKEELLRGIYAYGFEKPSAIQQVSGDC
jgi:translation initiation factor 4A